MGRSNDYAPARRWRDGLEIYPTKSSWRTGEWVLRGIENWGQIAPQNRPIGADRPYP
jgi:hypothetical protein